MNQTVSQMWHSADEHGKLEMLSMANQNNVIVDIEMIDDCVETLDLYARRVGMMAVYRSTVDQAGMSSKTAAVASIRMAASMPKRTWSKTSLVADMSFMDTWSTRKVRNTLICYSQQMQGLLGQIKSSTVDKDALVVQLQELSTAVEHVASKLNCSK